MQKNLDPNIEIFNTYPPIRWNMKMIEYNHLYHLYCHFSMFSRILLSDTSVWYVAIKKTLAVFFQNIKFCKAPNRMNF